MTDRVAFSLNGAAVDADAEGSLLLALREELGVTSVKDGCAPQGQCGCCTVLVDGEPRVACVTPVTRVAGRSVVTVEGLPAAERDALAEAFCTSGASQCGFCTPGILVRLAWALRRGPVARAGLDRALAAHLCRCTGWLSIHDAAGRAAQALAGEDVAPTPERNPDAAAERARLEGGRLQSVSASIPLGRGRFADDLAPRDALVAIPLPAGVDPGTTEVIEAAGILWVVGESLAAARTATAKVQGRRTTLATAPPIPLPPLPDGGVRLATSWVEPGYLEPDASWCVPGGEPASPLANGGAFGGKEHSPVKGAARELADRTGRTVRVLFAREDCVRLGPKRPPIAASAILRGREVTIDGSTTLGGLHRLAATYTWPYALDVRTRIVPVDIPGPPDAPDLRGAGWAEQVVLVEGALDAAGVDRVDLVTDARAAAALLDCCVLAPGGAAAGARVTLDPATGALERVEVRVGAGDVLDETVLRSYALGAVHMALGWVLTEGLAVDPSTGEVHDLTIRSFGILRSKDMPRVGITLLDEPGPPLPLASDAVFAATASATWNALALMTGARPESFPALDTPTSRLARR